jgi:hypothetical protein
MRKPDDQGGRVHQRIWELLPWYANGSLGDREGMMVEAHLAACPCCQEEVLACQRTAEAMKDAGEVAPSPHPVQFQRVLARIDESEREERTGAGWTEPLRAWLVEPRPLRGALLAEAAVILLLVGLLAWQGSSLRPAAAPAPAVYRTLSDPAAAPAPTLGLRVMFSPQASEREIRDLLQGVRGQITAGPSTIGVYTVEIPVEGDPVAVVLARLRSEPQVAFAEPAAGMEEKKVR